MVANVKADAPIFHNPLHPLKIFLLFFAPTGFPHRMHDVIFQAEHRAPFNLISFRILTRSNCVVKAMGRADAARRLCCSISHFHGLHLINGIDSLSFSLQVTPATPVSAAVTARAKMTTIPTVRRTRRNEAFSQKWPPISSGRGSSSI